MAEKIIQKIRDEQICSICLEIYTDPKQLQCHHIYCQKCLVGLVIRDYWGQSFLTCPACRQIIPVPANGVAGLQPAFETNKLLDILKEHTTPHYCDVHHGEELKVYCVTCEELICYKCGTYGHRHHNFKELNEAFQKCEREIEQYLATVDGVVAELTECREEVSRQKEDNEGSIHEAAKVLHERIDCEKTQFLDQLGQDTERKQKDIADQLREIQAIQFQFRGCLDNLKQKADQIDVLKRKLSAIKQVKQLANNFQPDSFRPTVEADTVFTSSLDISVVFGQLFRCYVTGEGLEKAVLGQATSVTFHAVSMDGRPLMDLTRSLTWELMSERTNGVWRGTAIRNMPSNILSQIPQYEITYTPYTEGWHQLHIKVEGQHVSGSPFRVEVSLAPQVYPGQSQPGIYPQWSALQPLLAPQAIQGNPNLAFTPSRQLSNPCPGQFQPSRQFSNPLNNWQCQ